MRPSSGDRVVAAVIGVFAVQQLALGAWMAIAPASFFRHVGPFGLRNNHYIGDSATWSLALGAALLIALRRPRWRLPVLAFAALQAALHALNHLADVGKAHPRYVGPLDLALLALSALVLAYAARRAAASEGAAG